MSKCPPSPVRSSALMMTMSGRDSEGYRQENRSNSLMKVPAAGFKRECLLTSKLNRRLAWASRNKSCVTVIKHCSRIADSETWLKLIPSTSIEPDWVLRRRSKARRRVLFPLKKATYQQNDGVEPQSGLTCQFCRRPRDTDPEQRIG